LIGIGGATKGLSFASTVLHGALDGWLSGLLSRGVMNMFAGNSFFDGYSWHAAFMDAFIGGLMSGVFHGNHANVADLATSLKIGLNAKTQRTLVETLRMIDDDAVVAVRSRPWLAQFWEGILSPKPGNTNLIRKFSFLGIDLGHRRITQILTGVEKLVYSDLDLAGLSIAGKGVDPKLIGKFAGIFNDLYTNGKTNRELYELIQHGALADADAGVWAHLLDDRGWKGVSKMLNETVYLFGTNGYQREMKFYDYLRTYYGP